MMGQGCVGFWGGELGDGVGERGGLTFLNDGVQVGQAFEFGDGGWLAVDVRHRFDELGAQTFAYFWVADDAVTGCDQGVLDCVDTAAGNAESFVLETVEGEFGAREIGLEHLAEDGLVVGFLVIGARGFFVDDAFDLGGDFLEGETFQFIFSVGWKR